MNILYIHQYFVTPQEPGATRSYWISKELVRRGHHVTVITGNSESKHAPGRFNRDGIDVIYENTESMVVCEVYLSVYICSQEREEC